MGMAGGRDGELRIKITLPYNLQKVTKCTQNNLVSTILVSKSIIGFVLF